MTNDLVRGDDVFFAATGVSDGDLLKGVRYYSGGASTNSLVMRCKSGTVRFVETYHKWTKPSLTNLSDEEMEEMGEFNHRRGRDVLSRNGGGAQRIGGAGHRLGSEKGPW